MTSRLVLVGGSAGSGKTTVARHLAVHMNAGWLQLDTVWIALKTAAGLGSAAYEVLDIDGRMRRGDDPDDAVLAAHVAAADMVCQVLPDVLAFELEAHPVLVADGAWLLPSFVADLTLRDTEVRSVFLHHAEVDAVTRALAPRLAGRPAEERHLRMNRQIWQYGEWVSRQARERNLTVLDPLPFATLAARALAALPEQTESEVAGDT